MLTVEPKVVIIIINWNGIRDTIECLESLKNMEYSNYSIVVVDNGSSGDDTTVLGQMFGGWIDLLCNHTNLGFTGGNNVAIRHALRTGVDYILLLNNDVTVEPDFLRDLVTYAETRQDVGVFGPSICSYARPSILDSTGGRVSFWRGWSANNNAGVSFSQRPSNPEEVDFVEGCSMLIKRSVIECIGLLDDQYFAYWEETDFCVRAKRAGFKVMVVPESRIYHKGGSSPTGPRKLYFLIRNNILFMRKNARFYHFITYIPICILWNIPVWSVRVLIRHPVRALSAIVSALSWHAFNKGAESVPHG